MIKKGMKVMKKIISILIFLALVVSALAFCLAADNDEWKNNTGTINLDEMTVTGNGITVNGNTILISKGGDFTVTGTQSDGMIRVSTEDKVKLRLSGMSLTNTSGPAIFFENTEKGFITVMENTDNYLADGATYSVDDADAALFSNDDLEIKGSGNLTINGNYKHGIASDDDLTVENGVITITSQEHGIKANDAVNITGGTFNITAKTGKGIKAGEALTVDAGTINVVSEESEGIESKGTIIINGGDINITAADDGINTGNENTQTEGEQAGAQPAQGENGISDKNQSGEMPQGGGRGKFDRNMNGSNSAQTQNGDMPQNGQDFGGGRGMDGDPSQMQNENNRPEMPMGEIQRGNPPDFSNGEAPQGNPPELPNGEAPQGGQGFGGGFDNVDEETAAAHAITINGGNIYIKTGCDGIDSNGNLTIAGGTIVIDGPENNGNGPLDAAGAISVTGGEIITVSSAGMVQLPQSSSQNILKVLFDTQGSAGDALTVKDSNNNEIMTHTAACSYSALVYSSPALKTGETYSIYVNGELAETAELTEGTTSVGSAQGQMMGGGGRFSSQNNIGQGSTEKNPQQNDSGITVSLDGESLSFDTNPLIKNETTLVGFRSILEALGAEVDWDGDTQTVTAKKDGTTVILKINSTSATVNGEEKTLQTAPEIINGSTMIPVRFISEQLGMNVDWDSAAKSIKITSK